MTREDVQNVVNSHNYEVERFIELRLPALLRREGFKVKDGRVLEDGARAWFTSQRLIKEQDFYKKAKAVCHTCRDDGWDVKIDCQREMLVFYGGRI